MPNPAGTQCEDAFCLKRISTRNFLNLVFGVATLPNDSGEPVLGAPLLEPSARRAVPSADPGELWSPASRKRCRNTDVSDLARSDKVGCWLKIKKECVCAKWLKPSVIKPALMVRGKSCVP